MTTTYVNFSSLDFKGEDSLSSFALKETPLRFIADLPSNPAYRVVWNFGDGTISKSFSASKSYEVPGVYPVNLVIFTCDDNAMISTFEKNITIVDYLPLTFNVDMVDNGISLKCGKIEGPYGFNAYYPQYQSKSNIFCYISASNSDDWWTKDNKFAHLENTHSLYDKIYNYAIQSYQYREVDKIELAETKVYAKIQGSSVVLCPESDDGAFQVGLSAFKEIYIKDDCLSDKVLYHFFFDKTNNRAKYINNTGITLSSNVIENPPTYLSITSNGLDGEGYPISSFNISPLKYYNTEIPFMVKLKDVTGFSVKNFDKIQLSALNITLSGLNSSQYSISSLNYTLSAQDSGGAFRGYVIFPNISSQTILQNIRICASGTFTNNLSNSYTLSGCSAYFNVYPLDYYDFYKKNENFDAEQTLKDLRFQETLLDKDVLFEDFLGGVLGDENSTHEGIGLKNYEKIANFVQNTQDLDKCEVECLDSIGDYVDYNDNREERYQFPEKIKRLVNTLSIDKSKLVGTSNKFRENLDVKGRTTKEEYGINIGNKIDTTTYTITAGVPIVALEKFSNTYNLLNTYQPISAVGASFYQLSAYNSDWGWPMVLPSVFDFKDIDKYYIFFEYVSQYDDTVLDAVIDFDNVKTTIPSTVTTSDMISPTGIMDNMFLSTLYKSLSLV